MSDKTVTTIRRFLLIQENDKLEAIVQLIEQSVNCQLFEKGITDLSLDIRRIDSEPDDPSGSVRFETSLKNQN